AALNADSRRCSAVIVSRRRLPPFRPPLRPIAAMTWEISSAVGVAGSFSGVVVAFSTICAATWLTSSVRLRERLGMDASYHNSSFDFSEIRDYISRRVSYGKPTNGPKAVRRLGLFYL